MANTPTATRQAAEKACKRLHLAYADAVSCGCMPPPRTEMDRLLYGMRPITAEDPSPVILQTLLRVTGEKDPEARRTVIAAHRYVPRAPRDAPPGVARAFHAWVEDAVPWVDGPPPFVRSAEEVSP